MPSNARRRRSKIVAPLTPNREQELIGGLKNALDRGETLAKAKQSFLNAGYKPEEINAAVQRMPMTSSQIVKPIADSREAPPAQPETKLKSQSPSTTTKIPGQKQKLSKKFLIILISIAVLILVGAALLGIFWDKIF